MNQEIKNAVNSTLPPASDLPALPPDFEGLIRGGPHSLATLGAALVVCPHPAECVVSADVTKDGIADTIHWCGACGSMGFEYSDRGGRAVGWERPGLVQQLHFDHLNDVAKIGRIVTLCADSAKELGDKLDRGEIDRIECFSGARELENALRTLVTLALFAELKRTRSARVKLAAGRDDVDAGDAGELDL